MNDIEFEKLYTELKLADNDGTMLTLHSHCPNCNSCWQNIQNRKPDKDLWTVTRPWIGSKYNELKILVIGINMNGYGSYSGAIQLINWAKEEIKRGKIKIFHSDTYNGTFFFHRMGSYITAFLKKANLTNPTWKGHYPESNDIVSSFDYISYTNHIKCSPIGEKSKPTSLMWEYCGYYILRKEIEILKPNKILILGNSDNFYYLNKNVLDKQISLKWHGKVGQGYGFINNTNIEITVVPHPGSFGGISSHIMRDLNCIINKSDSSMTDSL